uniref:Uncharacterized protein n=1 Tax=Oryza barthii TaxID=65489 RepID=A0A0D3FS15_9ORYZ
MEGAMTVFSLLVRGWWWPWRFGVEERRRFCTYGAGDGAASWARPRRRPGAWERGWCTDWLGVGHAKEVATVRTMVAPRWDSLSSEWKNREKRSTTQRDDNGKEEMLTLRQPSSGTPCVLDDRLANRVLIVVDGEQGAGEAAGGGVRELMAATIFVHESWVVV